MTNLIDTIEDGVEFANNLQVDITESNDYGTQKKRIKYLGQCLRVMKQHVSDYRKQQREQNSEECKC